MPSHSRVATGGPAPIFRTSALLALFGVCALANAPALAQFGVMRAPVTPPGDVAAEIANAAAESIYAVQLAFPRPLSVGDIRTATAELGIPRVLIHVEYPPRGMVILAIGKMYGEVPRRSSECRALLGLKTTSNALADVPIDEWPASRIHVYATAHTLRELLSGRRLPAPTIVEGYPQKPEHLQLMERQIPAETSQPLENPYNVDLPSYCAQFVTELDIATLSRGFPRGFEPPRAIQGEPFRQTAFRSLGQLPPDTAVTITLKLSIPANVELLATLVRDYDIRGMTAELVPERTSSRVIAMAELSSRGGDLDALVHRARCQMRLSGEEPQASSEWYADWISVSLSTENAVRFLSYPELRQAEVTGAHPIGALDRLDGYFERLRGRIYEMPRSMRIPSDCRDVYVHGNFNDVGTTIGVPPAR